MMTIPFRAGAVAAMTFRMRRRVGQIRPWRRGAASAGVAGVAPAAGRPAAQAQAPAAGRPGGRRRAPPGNRPAGKGGRLALRASDGKTVTVTSERSVNAIAQEFLKVYEALDGNQGLDARFDARLELLSVELLGPAPGPERAACVVFEITPASAFRAGSAARGRRALVPGQADRLRPVPAIAHGNRRACRRRTAAGIVRDPETDPENGAGEAQRLFPASDLLHIEQADPRMFAHADYDFLLISAYGSVTPSWGSAPDGEDDVIELGERDMEADALDGSRFKLVYLDSSQLGISESFIASARRGVRHFLAPLINNEAGNSSTLMIRYFFGGLSQGRSPMDAVPDAPHSSGVPGQGRPDRAAVLRLSVPAVFAVTAVLNRRVRSRESLHPSSR